MTNYRKNRKLDQLILLFGIAVACSLFLTITNMQFRADSKNRLLLFEKDSIFAVSDDNVLKSTEDHRNKGTSQMTSKVDYDLPFKYLLTPNITKLLSGKNSDIIVFIPCHYQEQGARNTIRAFWGKGYMVVFVTGNYILSGYMDLESESKKHGDILAINMDDFAWLLTYKTIAYFHWILTSLKNKPKYILRADSDTFVNIPVVLNLLKRIHSNKDAEFFLCHVVKNNKVPRIPESRWFVPLRDFPPNVFPNHCAGAAYVFPSVITKKLFDASFNHPVIAVDDAYTTGIIRDKTIELHHNDLMSPLKGVFDICWFKKRAVSHNMNNVEMNILKYWWDKNKSKC